VLGSEDPGGTLHVLILDDSVSQDKLESKQMEKNRSMEKYYSTGGMVLYNRSSCSCLYYDGNSQ